MGKPTYLVIQGGGYFCDTEMAIDEVVNGVQKYLDRDEGWEPTGGICVVMHNEEYYTAFQAIFKK